MSFTHKLKTIKYRFTQEQDNKAKCYNNTIDRTRNLDYNERNMSLLELDNSNDTTLIKIPFIKNSKHKNTIKNENLEEKRKLTPLSNNQKNSNCFTSSFLSNQNKNNQINSILKLKPTVKQSINKNSKLFPDIDLSNKPKIIKTNSNYKHNSKNTSKSQNNESPKNPLTLTIISKLRVVNDDRKFSILDITSGKTNSLLEFQHNNQINTNNLNYQPQISEIKENQVENDTIKKFTSSKTVTDLLTKLSIQTSTNTFDETHMNSNSIFNETKYLKRSLIKTNVEYLSKAKEKAFYLLVMSDLLHPIKKLKFSIYSKKIYSLTKATFLGDFTSGLIKQLKVIDSKYPNKQLIKEDISKWYFKFSLSTQIVINHLTQQSEAIIFESRNYSKEAKAIINILYIVFSIADECNYKNSLISLYSKYKALNLSKQ